MAHKTVPATEVATLHAGAAALQDLIRRVTDSGNAGLKKRFALHPDADEVVDARDYRALCDLVQASIESNVNHECAAHREGYLRALADLLCIVGDGCAPDDEWNPIANTARAFAGETSHV